MKVKNTIAVIICLMGLIIGMILSLKVSDSETQNATQETTRIHIYKQVSLEKKATKKKKTKKKKTTKKKTTKKKSTKVHSIAECKAFAHNEVINRYHWSESDWNALVKLWNKESGWKYNDKYGSCYGIPQACPGSKMKSAGSDYKTNCYTQINWGLGYIASRYGNPSNAWKHSKKTGWY